MRPTVGCVGRAAQPTHASQQQHQRSAGSGDSAQGVHHPHPPPERVTASMIAGVRQFQQSRAANSQCHIAGRRVITQCARFDPGPERSIMHLYGLKPYIIKQAHFLRSPTHGGSLMTRRSLLAAILLLALIVPLIAGCAPAPAPAQAPAPTQAPAAAQPLRRPRKRLRQPNHRRRRLPSRPRPPRPNPRRPQRNRPAATNCAHTSAPVVRKPGTLLLATTTSTADTGLLTAILPDLRESE